MDARIGRSGIPVGLSSPIRQCYLLRLHRRRKGGNGFSIWGIQLKSKKLPELALPQNAVVHKADPNAELPEPVIQYGKAMLKGKLLDSRPNMGMPISIAVWENIKGDITDIPLDIQPDGSFTKEVTLPGTTPCTIYLGREHMLQFFMEPGKTTEIYVNLREASRRKSKFHSEGKPYGEMVYINGPLETVAQELNGNHLGIDMQDKLYQNIAALAGKDIDAAKAYVLQISDETQEAIDKLPYSASTRQLLTINNKLITNAMLSSVASILTSAALHANLIKREEANNYYQELARKVPANYVSDEDMSILNVPQAVLSNQYVQMASRNVERSGELAKAWGTDKGIFFDIARNVTLYRGIKNFTPLTDEQKAIVAAMPAAYREMLTAANDELLAQLEANKKRRATPSTKWTPTSATKICSLLSSANSKESIVSRFLGHLVRSMPYGKQDDGPHEGGTERQGYPISVHHRRNLSLEDLGEYDSRHPRRTFPSDRCPMEIPIGCIQDRRGTDLSDCRPRRKHHVQTNRLSGSGEDEGRVAESD